MKASILNIGNELLQGFTVNTNATWLARELSDHSIEVKEILVIEDNQDSIVGSLKSMLNESYDYIFVTGGLGPTLDDVTQDAISFVFNSKKTFSMMIQNKHGTANGLYVKSRNSKIFFLPGVPREFKQMVVDEIAMKHFKIEKDQFSGNLLRGLRFFAFGPRFENPLETTPRTAGLPP